MEPHVVYITNQLLPTANKDALPVSQNSNVIYQFSYFHATAIIVTWAVLPKDWYTFKFIYTSLWEVRPTDWYKYKTESNNMFRNLSVVAFLSKSVTFQFENANLSPSQQLKLNLLRVI